MSLLLVSLNRIRKPANVASSIVRRQIDAKPISSMVSDVRVKNTSPDRTEYNFYKSFILNDAYVIGANRNDYVNLISIIFFALTFSGILLHTFFRIIKRK